MTPPCSLPARRAFVEEARGTMGDVAREVERVHSEYSSAGTSIEDAASRLDATLAGSPSFDRGADAD